MVISMKRSGEKDAGVSPVVGVMLMLVVTIIIAGIVSLTAAGFMDSTGTQTDEPQIEFVGLYTAGYTAATVSSIAKQTYQTEAAGLLFKVVGDKPVDLTKMKLYLASGQSSGGGGSVDLGYDDPVSTAYLPGGSSWNGRSQIILPPEYMRGYRIVMFGLSEDDPTIHNTIADPGDMFIVSCEYVNPSSPSLAIGLRKDDADGNTVISAGIGANGDAILTLVNAETGYVYVRHTLIESDMIATV
ncbi:hypothetical protein ASJ83_03415 [Methanocorpusculum parvum]|uniref:Archaeal Type IV pilin N-terminal domain-containing protein n=2 Tax=Methanocorpusculum parvum TaxID=2193 RepID=A0AAX0Q627_9EURY|nr:hypothetical protein ASJ83_03415 [Methanocorpusculum parvum]